MFSLILARFILDSAIAGVSAFQQKQEQGVRLARGSATPEDEEDAIACLGLSPIEPTRAASLSLVYHTARAASGRLVPTPLIRALAMLSSGKRCSPAPGLVL